MLLTILMTLFFKSAYALADLETENHTNPSLTVQKISCTAIRDEPGAPTYAFELVRKSNRTYEAKYLHLPGDESAPAEVVAKISDLKCRFYTRNKYYFQCQKFGASIESIFIDEKTLSLIANKIHIVPFKEFRAVGTQVPNTFMAFRFGKADRCNLR